MGLGSDWDDDRRAGLWPGGGRAAWLWWVAGDGAHELGDVLEGECARVARWELSGRARGAAELGCDAGWDHAELVQPVKYARGASQPRLAGVADREVDEVASVLCFEARQR